MVEDNKPTGEDGPEPADVEALNTNSEVTAEQTPIEVVEPTVVGVNEPEEPVIITEDGLKAEPDKVEVSNVQPQATGKFTKLKEIAVVYWSKKPWTLPLTVVVLLLILLAIPVTRYGSLGLFLKKPVTVTVVDSKSGAVVSSAHVTLAGQSFDTQGSGKASQKLKLGSSTLVVTKQYYKTASTSVTVTLSAGHNNFRVALVATGRQVPIKVTNKLTGQPLADATIKVLSTEAKTDKLGKATIVLPATAKTQKASLQLAGYNTANTTVQITDQTVAANSFTLTPAGQVYFLSNQSGKIDLVKTNLDGSNRQTVLAGTGNEQPDNTSLLASRDWKYLALLSRRTTDVNPELNLIDTSNDKVTNIDQGDASFTPVGWDNDYFVYVVSRNVYNNWQPHATSLKSFNAQTSKLTTLDNTDATGSSNADAKYEVLFPNTVHIVGDTIAYSKLWYSYPGYINVSGQQNTLTSVKADGSSQKTVGSYDGASAYYGTIFQYSPQELVIQVSYVNDQPPVYYKYDTSGNYTRDTDADDISALNNSYQTYPTYLQSPSNKQTFWSSQRDGKNALFIGDSSAENQKQIAALSDYKPYGWYSDNYLLLSKNSSELYIMAASGSSTPLKITDYYKPPVNYAGYGGGYGGL